LHIIEDEHPAGVHAVSFAVQDDAGNVTLEDSDVRPPEKMAEGVRLADAGRP
jgi:hypothetical protein